MLASNPADVGSTFVVSTFVGFDEFSGSVSLRSAMDKEVGLFTVYHSRGSTQRTPLLEKCTEAYLGGSWRRLLGNADQFKSCARGSGLRPRQWDHLRSLQSNLFLRLGKRAPFPPPQASA